jgi:HK97 family phage portal protein
VGFFGRVGAIVRSIGMAFAHPALAWSFVTGRSRLDFAGAVGDGSGSSIVVACFRALTAGFLEAPLQVERRTEDGWDAVEDHPMIELLARPNPHMSGRLFWSALITSLHSDGNAYAYKQRAAAGRVVELWPIPPGLIDPVWNADDFITAYRYQPGNGVLWDIDPRDVIHLRLNIDPSNTRKGRSPLSALYREIFTDLEAGEFTSQLLSNLGIPGVIISPDGPDGVTQEDAEAIKAKFIRRFSGDGRGEPLVMGSGTKVSVLSFSPEQMNLESLRRIPEERICAVLGVPPIIANLGAGLDQATYSNYAQAREAFYENTIIPLQAVTADDLRVQLLPEFGDIKGYRVAFDQSGIRVLQEDETKRQERILKQLAAGVMTVNEARTALDLEPDTAAGDIYLRQAGAVEVGWGQPGRTDAVGQNPNDPMAAVTDAAALPALRVVRALPAAETKAEGDGHTDRLAKLRRRLEPAFEKAVAKSLEAQAGRVARRLGRKDAKAPDPDDLLPKSEDGRLATEWQPHYTALLMGMWPILNEQLAVDVDFQLDDPAVVAALEAAGERVKGINDTTRAALARALQEGAEAGEGAGQLAARVRQVVEESYKGRAETISRTELAIAQQQATVGRYKAAGVSKVRVLDGDDDEVCARVNGSTQTLEWAEANAIAHPRCVRAFVPIIETEEAA